MPNTPVAPVVRALPFGMLFLQTQGLAMILGFAYPCMVLSLVQCLCNIGGKRSREVVSRAVVFLALLDIDI